MVARKVQRGSSRVQFGRGIAFAAVAICAAASLTSFAADRTISADYALTADETVDGVLTVDSGATVDLAGHNLTVKGLAGDGTIAGTGTLYVDTASGTVANSTVSLTGGLKLTVGGGGTFTASKASQSYTGGTEAAANTTISLGTATHPLGNGNATQTVTLREGAKFNAGTLANNTTCTYNFVLDGGNSMTFGDCGNRATRHFGSLSLQGDASLSYAGKSGMVGLSSSHSTITLNNHVLSVAMSGADSHLKYIKSTDAGTIRFTSGGGMQGYENANFSSATVEYTGNAFVHLGDYGFSVGGFKYGSSSKYYKSYAANPIKVYGKYVADTYRPPLAMQTGATLDVSGLGSTWNADGKAAYRKTTGNITDNGLVTFLAANAAYTVDVGTRTIAKDDVLVQFESGYIPTDSVVFNLAATGAAQTPEDRHLGVVAKDSGSGYYNLVVKDTLTPYARWVIDNDNPANSGWKFYNPTDDTENTDWRDGVTDDVEVRIFSYAEHQAIVAAGVSPFRYSLYGTIQIPGDAAEWNLTTCFDGMAEGASIDLNGKKLHLNRINFDGTITDTSADTDHPGELHVTVASGTIANTLVTLTGNLKLVKEGAGTFTASKANQSYTGGTEVLAGTLTLGTATHPLGDGNATQTVTVGGNGILNLATYKSESTCYYNLVLDEGAVVQAGDVGDRKTGRIASITLNGNATVKLSQRTLFGGSSAAKACQLTFRGHTLTLLSLGDGNLGHVHVNDYGTFRLDANNSNTTCPGMYLCVFDLRGAKLEVTERAFVKFGNWAFYATDFVYGGLNKFTGGACNKINSVYGRYVAGNYRPPFTMQDGSTLDLSKVSGAWSAAGAAIPSSHKDVTGPGMVSFASGATVTVDLSGRTDLRELAKSATPYVVTWSSQPNATFTLDAETAERFKIEPDGTGIKLVRRSGFTIFVR